MWRRCRRLLAPEIIASLEKLSRSLPRALPPGPTRLPASALGAAAVQAWEQHEAAPTAGDRDSIMRCIHRETAWFEVHGDAAAHHRHPEHEVAVVLLSGTFDDWLSRSALLLDVLRRHLMLKRGKMVTSSSTSASDPAVHIKRIRGASLTSYLRAAKRALDAKQTLVLVATGATMIDASGLDCGCLAVQHPHTFRTLTFELSTVHQPSSHLQQRRSDPATCYAVVPLPRAPAADPSLPPALQRGLAAFFSSREHLAPAQTSFLRLQDEVMKYLMTERWPEAPYPIPAALLHHELNWGAVERHLGSLLHALPETKLMRFGDNLLLPIDEGWMRRVMMPLLRRYAEEHGCVHRCPPPRGKAHTPAASRPLRHAAEVPIVLLFEWIWSRAVPRLQESTGEGARPVANVASTLVLYDLHRKRIGPLHVYEGYLAKWCLFYQPLLDVRNVGGVMHVTFRWN